MISKREDKKYSFESGCKLFRPIINNKFEEKTCGDGPSLSAMFQDDKHMQALVESIKVIIIDGCDRCILDFKWLKHGHDVNSQGI